MQKIQLNNGVAMPVLGYGVFQITDEAVCRRCVVQAIEDGYRLFDTASVYGNERAVGEGCRQMIAAKKVKRADLFLTTKVWLQDYGGGRTRKSVMHSIKEMEMDYLDLVLLHQPYGNWQAAWRELEALNTAGKIRAIGVSNFTEEKLAELLAFAKIKPAVNQIERHPFYEENQYVADMKQKGIQPEGWGALCEGLKGIFQNPVLTRIGERYHKTPAQVAIRWNIQTGCVALIKSERPEKIKEDYDVFDFELSREEVEEIGQLDAGFSEIIDFKNPMTERILLKSSFRV